MNYKDEFIKIFTANIKRQGAKELLDSLSKSDFFTAPASTRFHESFEGGLCQHSVNVYNQLKAECGDKYSAETIAICGLLHDVCKVGYYKVDYRNAKDETGKWVKVPYYTVDDMFPFGHGEKSVYLIEQYIKLTTEEAMAIRWHMGGYNPKDEYQYISNAFEKFPLAVYTHIADLKATYLKGDTE